MEISVKEYASKFNISVQAVYQKIKANKLETKKDKEGNTLIIVKDTLKEPEQEKATKTESVELLNEKIKHLEEMLQKETEAREKAEKREDNLTHLLAMSNQNINNLSENIKALEHKTEVIEEELQEEKKKTWIDKLFKRENR